MAHISLAAAKKLGLIDFHPNRRQVKAVQEIPWVEMGYAIEPDRLTVFAPAQLVSEANRRCHWAIALRRKKAQQAALAVAFLGVPRWTRLPCEIRIVRLFRKQDNVMDGDNLQRAAKAIRDQLAAWVGVDDGDARIRWEYPQECGAVVGVRIEFSADGGEMVVREFGREPG